MTAAVRDHGRELAALEDAAWAQVHGAFGVSWHQGYRRAQRDTITWLLQKQRDVENLTVTELVWELRKGPDSIYWPLYEGDPSFWGVCDRCRTRVLIDVEAVCTNCGHEHI